MNGYLADSIRTRAPQNQYNYNPTPLDRSHANPFVSPPPERMPTHRTKPRPNARNGQTNDQANHSMRSLNTTESGSSRQNTPGRSGSRRLKKAESEDMEDFGKPGPSIYTPGFRSRHLSSDRPSTISSYEHVMIFARGDVIPGYNPDGTRIKDPGTDAEEPMASRSKKRMQTDGFDEGQLHSRRPLRVPSEHKPLVRGPPGSFFKNILYSKTNPKTAGQSEEPRIPSKTRTRQVSARDYPTNSLRPLSLVQDLRPATPSTRSTDGTLEWAYRSPLTAPKRQSSRLLYSNRRLTSFDKEAQVEDHHEEHRRPSDPLPINIPGNQRYLQDSPRILSWSRDSSARSELADRKWWLSLWVFVICNFLPPSLLSYGMGGLDRVAVWWTSGEIRRFSRPFKIAAYIIFGIWVLAIFLALIAVIVWWFGFGRFGH